MDIDAFVATHQGAWWRLQQLTEQARKLSQVSPDELNEAVQLYQRKYPFVSPDNPAIGPALAKVNWYRLRPRRLYWIDNSLGLGHRDEIQVSSEQ